VASLAVHSEPIRGHHTERAFGVNKPLVIAW
jgi:hypothetical protein